MNNKILLAVFSVLLVLLGLTQFFSGEGERTFDPEIIKVDTAQVTSVILRSKADNRAEVLIRREENGWTVTKENKTYQASQEAVNQLLANLSLVKSAYIAAKKQDEWPKFEADEDNATRLTVFSGTKLLTDFYIGKFSVDQQAQQITSFFRLKNSEEVYAVEGMAGMMLGQGFSSYRSKTLLDLDIHAVKKLEYEGDAAYTVAKSGDRWLLDDAEPLDTNKVWNFLMNLRSIDGDDFVNDFDPGANPGRLLKKLTIGSGNTNEPVVVQAWQDTSRAKPFVIRSSQNPDAFFASDSTRLFKRIFKPVSEW